MNDTKRHKTKCILVQRSAGSMNHGKYSDENVGSNFFCKYTISLFKLYALIGT
jgi:hypothetical protein